MFRCSVWVLGLAASLVGAAPLQAATPIGLVPPLAPQTQPVQYYDDSEDYVIDGQDYCWYDDGWNGPGWYVCDYGYSDGYGWGGGEGWNGFVTHRYAGRGHRHGGENRHGFGGFDTDQRGGHHREDGFQPHFRGGQNDGGAQPHFRGGENGGGFQPRFGGGGEHGGFHQGGGGFHQGGGQGFHQGGGGFHQGGGGGGGDFHQGGGGFHQGGGGGGGFHQGGGGGGGGAVTPRGYNGPSGGGGQHNPREGY